jgi:hypothetical protein
MLLKSSAMIIGLILIILGIIGFIPALTPEGKLLDIFMVNPMHNLFHLVSGAIALLCGLNSSLASKIFFIIFGIIYLIVAILGFMIGEGMVLDFLAVNQADNILHVVIAFVALSLGSFFRAT